MFHSRQIAFFLSELAPQRNSRRIALAAALLVRGSWITLIAQWVQNGKDQAKSGLPLFQQIFWIFQKELRYALRDTDILIYAVLVPLLLYPTMILGISEVIFWQIGGSRQKFKVMVLTEQPLAPQLHQALAHAPEFELAVSSTAMQDLKNGKVDVVISSKDSSDKYAIQAYIHDKKGCLAVSKVDQVLTLAQRSFQEKAMKEHHVPSSMLNVCNVSHTRLVPFGQGKAQVELGSNLGILCAVAFGVVQIALVASVASVCMFAEEKEKRTFETTMSLPISKLAITIGKWLAASTLSLTSGLTNILILGSTFIVVLIQAMTMQKANWRNFFKSVLHVDVGSCALAILTIALITGLSCAVCMLCVSVCRNFKEGQSLSSYPTVAVVTLCGLAVVPGIEHQAWIFLVPVTNLLIVLKHPQGNNLILLLSVIETVGIIFFCLWLAGKTFFSDKSVSAIAGSFVKKRPHQQMDTV